MTKTKIWGRITSVKGLCDDEVFVNATHLPALMVRMFSQKEEPFELEVVGASVKYNAEWDTSMGGESSFIREWELLPNAEGGFKVFGKEVRWFEVSDEGYRVSDFQGNILKVNIATRTFIEEMTDEQRRSVALREKAIGASTFYRNAIDSLLTENGWSSQEVDAFLLGCYSYTEPDDVEGDASFPRIEGLSTLVLGLVKSKMDLLDSLVDTNGCDDDDDDECWDDDENPALED
jgi:hypothetical protein